MSFFAIVGLLLCIQTPGSSAVPRVFVKKGEDVLLEVPKSFARQQKDILIWRFNARDILVRFIPGIEPDIFDNYAGRVSVTNYSVKLKNLQAADSGVYDAQVSGARERIIAEYSVTVQGSSAVFVQKGKDVLLEVPKSFVLPENDLLTWRFNENNVFVRFFHGRDPTISKDYTGRVSVTNFSVKLKNLQAADSGVYEARVIGDKERTIAEYNVTVQDPVSPVELNVDSVLSRSDSCIINATCRTVDSDISSSFRCVNQTCDQDGGEQSKTTNSGASLSIYLSNVSIFCNHSNQVSWTENMKKIQDFCKLDPESLSICLVKTVVFSVGLIIMVSAVISVHLMEKCKKQK